MSGEQNELVARLRRAYAAANRGDYDQAVSEVRLDPEFEFARLGGQAAISGAEAFREWLEPDAIESLVMEPRKMQPVGRRVLVEQHATGRGAASGIELSLDAWAVWTFDEEGNAIHLEAFHAHERAQALAAAGLDLEE